MLNFNQYSIKATVWLYQGDAAWHFVSVPVELSANIKQSFGGIKRGWGSIPVLARIKETEWKTSIFYDNKTKTYMLPIKKSVRGEQKISQGTEVEILIEILV